MGRLKQLEPRCGGLKARGSSGDTPVRSRDRIDTWRKWYNTRQWRDLRWSVLVDELFTCRLCGRDGDSPVMVADHIKPHRGNRVMFFDRNNLQCLCKQCHDRDKQKEERQNAYRND